MEFVRSDLRIWGGPICIKANIQYYAARSVAEAFLPDTYFNVIFCILFIMLA